MKKTLLISGVLLALTASVASAGGVNLSWTDCGVNGATNMNFLCNTNSGGVFQLFGSFEPNAPMADCVGDAWVIDLQSNLATLPAWWSLKGSVDPPGRCRDASLTYNTNFAAGPFSCLDPWAGSVGLQGNSYTIGFSGANTARIVGFASLNASFPVAVAPPDEYYAFSLVINRAKTVGTGNCADCLDPVCIVLNTIEVAGLALTQKISNARDNNYATWQGGAIAAPGCPLATPTNKSSWGQVKSLYR